MKANRKYTVISILSIAAFFAIWTLATDVLRLFPEYSLPSPIKVASTFVQKLTTKAPDGSTLFQHLATSLKIALVGYAMGVGAGVPLGILMAWYEPVDKFVRPIFDLFRPIPTIAWIPLMILWLGIGLLAKATLIFIGAFIPSVVNAYTGIKQTSMVHIWVARTFGASKLETLWRIAIPSALPEIFTGLRVALGAAWMALIAAELLASSRGLGYMIQIGRMLSRPDIILVGMLSIGAVGALLSFILRTAEKLLVGGR